MSDALTDAAFRPAKPHFAVGFVGRSGVGKTTLAAKVLAELCLRGWRVAAIKDAHHHIDLDTPGKDTWVYRESGAARVILRTQERWAVMVETPSNPPTVEDLLAETGDVDIVLVEGFKREGSFPKIEVLRKAAFEELLLPDAAAVACDFDCANPNGVPRLNINSPSEVADFVEQLALSAGLRPQRGGRGSE